MLDFMPSLIYIDLIIPLYRMLSVSTHAGISGENSLDSNLSAEGKTGEISREK